MVQWPLKLPRTPMDMHINNGRSQTITIKQTQNPKHVPADPAVGLSPAAHSTWPAKRAPPANKALTPSLIRMVSCSFSASSDMVALVLVVAWVVGSNNYDEQARSKRRRQPCHREKASRSIGTNGPNLRRKPPRPPDLHLTT